MTDRPWRRDEPDSPCQTVCMINPATGYCLGCARTAAEIADWARMTPDERRSILAELHGRDPGAARRRGGRRARMPGPGS